MDVRKVNAERKEANFIGVTEASKETSINPETLKRYLRNHSEFLDVKKEGRRYKINVESLEVLRKIKHHYDQGLLKDDVTKKLETSGLPITYIISDQDDSEENLVSVNDELAEMKNAMRLMIESVNQNQEQMRKNEEATRQTNEKIDKQNLLLQQQLEENKKMHEELLALKQELGKKDSDMIAEMRKSMEEKQQLAVEAAVAKEKEKEKPFWKKFF